MSGRRYSGNGNHKTVTLGDIFEIARGGSPRPIDKFITDDPSGMNWVLIGDAKSKYITSTKKRIKKEGTKKSREVRPGDFLLTNSMSFGRPYIMQTTGCIHDGWLVLSPRGENTHPDYFYHLLGSSQLYAEFSRRASGATVKNLNIELVKAVQVPLPSMQEQRRVSSVLDKADELRAKRRAALAELDTLNAAVFAEMFGDAAAIFEKWPAKSLGDLLTFLTSGSRGWAKHYAERGDLFLRIQNVRHDELDLRDVAYVNAPDTAEAKRTLVQPGDVLLSITADLGRTAVIPETIGKAFINQHLCILRTKSLVPRFLSAYLASPDGQRQIQRQNRQAVKAGLNFEDIRSFVIPTPPIETQREFANRITTIEAIQAKHRAALAELDALFASLQHRAFRGEL